jgi:hypothetical protein
VKAFRAATPVPETVADPLFMFSRCQPSNKMFP